MAKLRLKGKDLRKLGYPENVVVGLAIDIANRHYKHLKKDKVLAILEKVVKQPKAYLEDEILGRIANSLVPKEVVPKNLIKLETNPKDFNVFGGEYIQTAAITQMENAMRLPVTEAGALMPDAHLGYGLPIGGVLATRNAIIPYAVGMDIGCRMALTVYDLRETYLEQNKFELKKTLTDWTCFGMGKELPLSLIHI